MSEATVEPGIVRTKSGRYRAHVRGKWGPTVDTKREAREWIAAQKQEEPKTVTGREKSPEHVKAMVLSRMIGQFITECREARTNGKSREGIALGALPGFPQWTSDPDVIDQAVAAIEKKANAATSPVSELRLRQRARDLRREAEAMRTKTEENGAGNRAFFVQYGKQWADENGIEYATFRDMGVPADTLKEAGIHWRQK